MENVFALKAIDKDNVATVFTNNVTADMTADVVDKREINLRFEFCRIFPMDIKWR